jgi:hypothetical protein
MKFNLFGLVLSFLISSLSHASDTSLDFAISNLDVPIQNPENGDQSISMVFFEADLTFHARSIGLNGFIRDTAGYMWATFGSCRYSTEQDLLYCGFNIESVTGYFAIEGPSYSGEITVVDTNGQVFDKGTATAIGL